jgi:hypothetical protein
MRNKPVGDNARKGALKKRSQVKTKLGGATAWTKRSKKASEFMAAKKPAKKTKAVKKSQGRQIIQGRAGREESREKEEGAGRRPALIN